uniref:DUF7808 domain-containing protein n=1 Tax=Panagrellus redivivus TaxID=6233 RepID=A0A7E4ZRE7_PANRE
MEHPSIKKRPIIGNIRTLCPLNCANSDDAVVLNKLPSNNHKCAQHFNYGITRIGEETFFWRSGNCLNQIISFDVRCGFPFRERDFVDTNRDQFFSLI